MTQTLPYADFKWVDNVDVNSINDNADKGYFLEVDLEYPQEVHDSHKDLPFCAEHMAAPGSQQQKLLTTLYDKERYVIHYRALKQAIQNGFKL